VCILNGGVCIIICRAPPVRTPFVHTYTQHLLSSHLTVMCHDHSTGAGGGHLRGGAGGTAHPHTPPCAIHCIFGIELYTAYSLRNPRPGVVSECPRSHGRTAGRDFSCEISAWRGFRFSDTHSDNLRVYIWRILQGGAGGAGLAAARTLGERRPGTRPSTPATPVVIHARAEFACTIW
jgi:hypothetical protein